MRSLIKNLLLSVVAVASVILLLEVVIRIAYPARSHLYIPATAYDLSSPVRRYVPNARFEIIAPEFRMRVVINSKGLRDRDRDYEPNGGVYRMLGLGDSFTFGTGVSLEEAYLSILEEKLNATSERRIEIIKAGHTPTSTCRPPLTKALGSAWLKRWPVGVCPWGPGVGLSQR